MQQTGETGLKQTELTQLAHESHTLVEKNAADLSYINHFIDVYLYIYTCIYVARTTQLTLAASSPQQPTLRDSYLPTYLTPIKRSSAQIDSFL